MSSTPELVRRTLFKRLHSQQFNFPHAAARLIATVYEPRSNGRSYSEAFISELTETQNGIEDKLLDELANSERSSLGAIEKYCLDQATRLLDSDATSEYSEVISRLRTARALAKGDINKRTQSEDTGPYLRKLPDPVVIKEDRPPFGRWR